MNTVQTIFTIFFAISWGIVSNVMPKWKAFHYSLFFSSQSFHRHRIIAAFIVFNILPLVMFSWVLWLLAKPEMNFDIKVSMSFENLSQILFGAMIPGLIPFGFYRLWIVLAHIFRDKFYDKSEKECFEQHESDLKSMCKCCLILSDLSFALLYLFLPVGLLIYILFF